MILEKIIKFSRMEPEKKLLISIVLTFISGILVVSGLIFLSDFLFGFGLGFSIFCFYLLLNAIYELRMKYGWRIYSGLDTKNKEHNK